MNPNSALRDKKERLLSIDWVRAAFLYSRETGLLFWRLPTKSRRKSGEVAGTVTKWGYRQIQIDRRSYMAHRLAWFYVHGVWPVEDLDHVNGDRADNRIENLRYASRSQNSANGQLRSSNSSGHTGVSWDKSKQRWSVSLNISGKQVRIGRFRTLDEAIAARDRAHAAHYGEFARIPPS